MRTLKRVAATAAIMVIFTLVILGILIGLVKYPIIGGIISGILLLSIVSFIVYMILEDYI